MRVSLMKSRARTFDCGTHTTGHTRCTQPRTVSRPSVHLCEYVGEKARAHAEDDDAREHCAVPDTNTEGPPQVQLCNSLFKFECVRALPKQSMNTIPLAMNNAQNYVKIQSHVSRPERTGRPPASASCPRTCPAGSSTCRGHWWRYGYINLGLPRGT